MICKPQTAGEWEINVSHPAGSPDASTHNLPPVRIAAVEQGWLPVVSGLNPKTTYDQSNSARILGANKTICVN